MALLTIAEARKFVRQPAVWVSVTAYVANATNNANIIAQVGTMHEQREWMQDVVNPAIQDPADPGPIAVSYNQDVTTTVAETPYRPAITGEAARSIALKSIVAGCNVPLNYLSLTNDDEPRIASRGNSSTPQLVELEALIDEVRGKQEQLIITGNAIANPDEFSGYLAGDFPAQNVATGADLLDSINEAIDAVNAGGGISKCTAISGINARDGKS